MHSTSYNSVNNNKQMQQSNQSVLWQQHTDTSPLTPEQLETLNDVIRRIIANSNLSDVAVWGHLRRGLALRLGMPILSLHFPPALAYLNQYLLRVENCQAVLHTLHQLNGLLLEAEQTAQCTLAHEPQVTTLHRAANPCTAITLLPCRGNTHANIAAVMNSNTPLLSDKHRVLIQQARRVFDAMFATKNQYKRVIRTQGRLHAKLLHAKAHRWLLVGLTQLLHRHKVLILIIAATALWFYCLHSLN